MAMYTNLYCSNCRKSISGGYIRSGFQSGIGLPFLKCDNCGTLNVTGKRPFKELSALRKFAFWAYAVVKGVLIGGALGMLVFTIFALIVNDALFETIYHKSFVLFFVIYFIYLFVKENIKSIQIIEKANNDKNYTLYAFNG
ncbi:MAG: hypothetical protein V4546_14275 [Bacteroidota bacterium]